MRIVTTVSAWRSGFHWTRDPIRLTWRSALHVRIGFRGAEGESYCVGQIYPDEALREIERVENERRTFIRRHYAEDVTQSSHYDVVVNSGTNGVEGAASLIKEAYRARFGKVPNLDVSTAPAALGPVID